MVAPKSKSQEQIETLHAAYKRLTKMDVGLRFNRESSWLEFIRQGFTESDLTAVVARLVALIKIGERKPESLKFSNLIEALDRFEEELAMTKAEANGLKIGEPNKSVWELTQQIENLHEQLELLEDYGASKNAFGLDWHNHDARDKYIQLHGRMRQLQDLVDKA